MPPTAIEQLKLNCCLQSLSRKGIHALALLVWAQGELQFRGPPESGQGLQQEQHLAEARHRNDKLQVSFILSVCLAGGGTLWNAIKSIQGIDLSIKCGLVHVRYRSICVAKA